MLPLAEVASGGRTSYSPVCGSNSLYLGISIGNRNMLSKAVDRKWVADMDKTPFFLQKWSRVKTIYVKT